MSCTRSVVAVASFNAGVPATWLVTGRTTRAPFHCCYVDGMMDAHGCLSVLLEGGLPWTK